MVDLLVLPRPARNVQSILGLLKRKWWPQYLRESSWQVRQSRFCQKGKEQSRQFRAPDRKKSIQCQRSKEEQQQQSKEKETSIYVLKDSVSGSKNKVISTSFLEIQGKKTFVGAKNRRKKDG